MMENEPARQGGLEWMMQRRGKVTASGIHAIMGKSANTYNEYFYRLMEERLTPIDLTEDSLELTVRAVKWGIQHEKDARSKYVEVTNNLVTECGFIDHPYIPMAGASPDGLVGLDDKGLIEIKCPFTTTHLKFCHNLKINPRYMYQMQFQLACTGRDWCDFVSYDPRLYGHKDLMIKIVRVERDEKMIRELEARVVEFLDKLDRVIMQIKSNARD